jgi:endogenous inhibitor of DNA gyrase (YacG/DUF329 family)
MNHAVLRKCTVCGEKFDSYNQKKVCSDACKLARKKKADARCRHGLGFIGSTKDCPQCGKKFVVTGASQIYCSPRCGEIAKPSRQSYKVKNIPAVCEICGNAFLTSKHSRGRTCSIDCTIKLRSKNMMGQTGPKKLNDSLVQCEPMPDIWNGYTDAKDRYWPPMETYVYGVKSWDDPRMDPMTNRMDVVVRVNIQDIRERAA